MTLTHSTVTDSSLLPFATDGSLQGPDGWSTASTWYDLSGAFENGLTLGDQVFTGLRVWSNGTIEFGNGQGWQDAFIRAFYDYGMYADPTVPNSGIWVDTNTTRDSIVITWNGLSEYSGSNGPTNRFQVEIRDLGDSDAEVIFRYDDLQWADRWYNPDWSPLPMISVRGTDGDADNYQLPAGRMGFPAGWDSLQGNTGVEGVWQFRIEDGTPDLDDFATPFRNLQGTEGDDTLLGWLGTDILRGFGGNDRLDGDGNHDTITGDDGDDTILGGKGNDSILGGIGHDVIHGGDDNDTIGAGEGDDTVTAGAGNDVVQGGDGANRIFGQDGRDYIATGSGDDAIDAGNDSDTVNAGAGNDTVTAGQGHDTVYGGNGDDLILVGGYLWGNNFLSGDAGNDRIIGSNDIWDWDTLLGGTGDDTLDGAQGDNTLSGGDGNDVLRASYDPGSTARYNTNLMNGGDGDDNIIGANGNDTLGGQAGNDHIEGREGDDSIGAGDGSDTVLGGAGRDFIFGGLDADSLSGGTGNDTLFGDSGDDTILGGDGNDELLGGDGDDFIFGGAGIDNARGGDGADRFFASTGSGTTVIHDYNPDEGDWLVLDGAEFTRENLRLQGERLTDLDGNPAEFLSLSLVYVGDDSSLSQTLFTLLNATDLSQLIIRLPEDGGTADNTIYLDLA